MKSLLPTTILYSIIDRNVTLQIYLISSNLSFADIDSFETTQSYE